ncbi:competence type IV pilus minor pilin ComGD [Bacillus sp. SD088]|uniref:competence type IV pilus minor pilin ComGD n=1 Tax=Bacillus sp. SD088 TaxID=2782012 RepID=UPI001A959CE6|nr:competence type IV pilus minor pilin ComGD [Bacillus sp. SD088]MBO0995254.1 prepilin-type N-terminal cleavage/methylation domain-containing protein [Bacillus sp. SD088]
MKHIQSSKGFTLLEMLIVLSVVSIILLFSIFTYQSFSDMLEKKTFITQLEADLYYAHAYALSRRDKVQIQFSSIKKEYKVIDVQSGEIVLERRIPSTIYIQKSNVNSFVINSEGNVSNFGTIIFQQHQHTIKLTFYIGKGRFRIEE